MPHKFSPHSIERLLRPDRFGDLDISGFLRGMGLDLSMTFADIGCGPGFFSGFALKVVGPEGLVYAVDTQQEMLDSLPAKIKVENLIPVLSREESLPIKDSCIDFVFSAYVLHEVLSAEDFLSETKRIMKDNARLLIIDWDKLREEHGPPYDDRIPRGQAAGLLKGAGFSVIKEGVFSKTHYLFLVKKRP